MNIFISVLHLFIFRDKFYSICVILFIEYVRLYMNKKNKVLLVIVSLLLVLTITIGISYAYWKLNFTQTAANSLATDCFSITFTEDNNISLINAYPLVDADGEKLTPYTFTIKNNCTSYASYQVNLEVLNTSTLADSYLKMQLDSNTPR